MIFEDDTFTWKDIESGNAYMQFRAGSTAPTSI